MSTPISKDEAFSRLGNITREMHEALAVLGGNQLHSIVDEMPNARDRLAHVGKMTEEAANKVLNLVDKAKPECDDLSKRGVELGQSIAKMAASEDLSVERARALMGLCGKFAERTAAFASGQADVLSDIMMAQDFQDLSGQVIKKVVTIIGHAEQQLQQMLARSEGRTQTGTVDRNNRLEGPQVPDKAVAQDDVDDLLASLGF